MGVFWFCLSGNTGDHAIIQIVPRQLEMKVCFAPSRGRPSVPPGIAHGVCQRGSPESWQPPTPAATRETPQERLPGSLHSQGLLLLGPESVSSATRREWLGRTGNGQQCGAGRAKDASARDLSGSQGLQDQAAPAGRAQEECWEWGGRRPFARPWGSLAAWGLGEAPDERVTYSGDSSSVRRCHSAFPELSIVK